MEHRATGRDKRCRSIRVVRADDFRYRLAGLSRWRYRGVAMLHRGSDITGRSSMQVLVVGAGAVGLACARALALKGHEVIVAEATNAIGTMTSSRNGEVIHAGLYYPTGTKRAVHCPLSRRMLYDYCASHGVPPKKGGKAARAPTQKEKT